MLKTHFTTGSFSFSFDYLYPSNFKRAKKLITRVGDQDPEFYKRDILKLGDEIINNFSNESAENKELLMKHFVEW